ncbi:hypothetical protein, partial [Methanosarcina mazei]|uniref:hypothetical protein n=1 Tax=Methanosarcina mazei TaxID=2209 RepID=UPI00064FE7E2
KIFKVKNEEARVHFIPTLKDGVFVTLCAPLVIKTKIIKKIVPLLISFPPLNYNIINYEY